MSEGPNVPADSGAEKMISISEAQLGKLLDQAVSRGRGAVPPAPAETIVTDAEREAVWMRIIGSRPEGK